MWNKHEVVAYRVFATFMLKNHVNLSRAGIKSSTKKIWCL
jgi:hypothetical protein